MRGNEKNLTELQIQDEWNEKTIPQENYSLKLTDMPVEVVFRDNRAKAIEFIERFDAILGAVAWFTDLRIIRALEGKRVAIILQKEDFLRPDVASSRQELWQAYGRVQANLSRYELPGIAAGLSYGGDPYFDAFRCVGNFNREKHPAMPRMHNKFLIGCDVVSGTDGEVDTLQPRSVWTGSYNLTFNAERSLENSIIIDSDDLAEAYANEWAQIFALSEPLDWKTDWVAPEYRIGS